MELVPSLNGICTSTIKKEIIMAETQKTTLVHSDNIHIFPVAKIRTEQRSRILYEDNVSNIIRQLIDTNGFVLPDNPTIFAEYVDTTSGDTCVGVFKEMDDQGNINTEPFRIKFNIYGYYVEITNTILTVNTYDKVFAKLSITKGFPQEISGQDITITEGTSKVNVYQGVELIATDEELQNSEDDTCRHIYLKLLERFDDGDNIRWRIPLQSYSRFDFSKLITGIDGKI